MAETFPGIPVDETGDIGFLALVRDRCFESMLMLRLADFLPDDPRVQKWAAAHADPEPEGGLTAVVPNACVDAVSEFVRECGWPELEHELTEVVLDGGYEVIDLLQRSVDEDPPERLFELFSSLPGSWADPVARPQIEELVHTANRAEHQRFLVIRPARRRPEAPVWSAQVGDLRTAVTKWTGNDARVLEYGADELAAGRVTRDRVLRDAMRHALFFHGSASAIRRRLCGAK